MSVRKDGKIIAGITVNSDLFDWKWADHILNNSSWLRADTFSWQNGERYQIAYQHLVDEFDITKPIETETFGGVTVYFRTSPDGHKIVLADGEQDVINMYNTTGDAWYYILDLTNQKFKLPRAKPLNGAIAGNGMALGVTDGTTNYGVGTTDTYYTGGCFTGKPANYGANISTSGGQGGYAGNDRILGITTDSTKSGIIAERDNTNQYKYLYFYVGEFTQTALQNTAGIVTEDFNELNAHKVIEFQAPTAQNNYTWYRKYADGWVEQGGAFATVNSDYHNETVTLLIEMNSVGYSINVSSSASGNAYTPVISTKSSTGFTVVRLVNIAAYSATWQVSGMAA